VALWHAQIGSIENAPETYTVDGRQYVLVTAEGALYAFYLQ
jgi:alcohol dehydrogenase (cytochrome c)